MSGLKRLEEDHKRCVELIIRGTPRDEIARTLGIARSTVYAWMKDPLVQIYYEKLISDLEAARRQRLLPIFLLASEGMELAIRQDMRYRESEDPKEQLKAAPIATFASVLEKVYRMERSDAGEPSQISEDRKTLTAEGGPRKRTRLELLLDGLMEDAETVETTAITEGEKKD